MSTVRLPFDQTIKALIVNIDKALAENRRQQEEIQNFPDTILNDDTPLWDEHVKKNNRLIFPMEEAIREIYGGVQRLWRNRNGLQLLKALRNVLEVPPGGDVHAAAEAALQPGGSGIDWDKVAEKISGAFDPQETKNHYLSVLHPSANSSSWTREEELLLLSIVEHNPTDWNEAALQLGTNRTGFQVFKHYRQSLSNLLLSEWTDEQDQELSRLVESSKVMNGGRINWHKVAQAMDRRTPSQCSHRYEMSLADEQFTKSTWSDQETNQILRLYRVFGPRWRKIAEFMPHRKEMQIRCHYMHNLLPELNRGKCTPEEASQLVFMVKKYGPGDWSRIAAEIPGRTDKWVRTMFARLMPSENDIYHQLLTRKAYCNLPRNVSSSRKRANLRPKVTAAEFEVPVLPSFEDAHGNNLEILELTGHPRTDQVLKCTNKLRQRRLRRSQKNDPTFGKQPALEDGNVDGSPLAKKTTSGAAPSSTLLAIKPGSAACPRLKAASQTNNAASQMDNAVDPPRAVPACSRACKWETAAPNEMGSDASGSYGSSAPPAKRRRETSEAPVVDEAGLLVAPDEMGGDANSSNSRSAPPAKRRKETFEAPVVEEAGVVVAPDEICGDTNSSNSRSAPSAKRRKEMSRVAVVEDADVVVAPDEMCGDASSNSNSRSARLAKRRKETPRVAVVEDTGVVSTPRTEFRASASLTKARVDTHTASRPSRPTSASSWRSDSAGRSPARTTRKTVRRTHERAPRKTASPAPTDPSTDVRHIAHAEDVTGGTPATSRGANSAPKCPLPMSRGIASSTRPKRAPLGTCDVGASDPSTSASSTPKRVQRRVASGKFAATPASRHAASADNSECAGPEAGSVPDEDDATFSSASSSRKHERLHVASTTLRGTTTHLTAAAVLEHEQMTQKSPRALSSKSPPRLDAHGITAQDRENVASPNLAPRRSVRSFERRSDCDTLLSLQCDTDSLPSSCNPQCGDEDATLFGVDATPGSKEGATRNPDYFSQRSGYDCYGNPQTPVWNEEIDVDDDPYLLAYVSETIDGAQNDGRSPYCLDDDDEAEVSRGPKGDTYDLDSSCDEGDPAWHPRESDEGTLHAGNSYCFNVGNLTAC